MEVERIKSFRDLNTWKEGHKLVLLVYKMVGLFPQKEKFGLISQLSRAVVSITSNIAEGFARRTYKDKLRFYYMSLGSLVEVQNQILIARDVGYISKNDFYKIANQTVVVSKLINGLIKKTKTFLHNS